MLSVLLLYHAITSAKNHRKHILNDETLRKITLVVLLRKMQGLMSKTQKPIAQLSYFHGIKHRLMIDRFTN